MYWTAAATWMTAFLSQPSTTRLQGGTTNLPSSSEAIRNNNKNDGIYDALLDWLRASPDSIISNKIQIQESGCGAGYGAFVSEACDAEELLFEIPVSQTLKVSDALMDDTIGKPLQALVEKAGPGGNTVALAGFLAQERLKGSGSRYAPYLNSLPCWERDIENQEHILHWDDEEVEELLEGTMSYGEALDLRKEVSVANKVLRTIFTPKKSGFVLPWERFEEETKALANPEETKAAVVGSFVTILTRAFQDLEGDDEKLVPLLDMLQHSDTPNVAHVTVKATGAVQVRARKDLAPGTELLNQYRSELEENMPYHRFFTRFGFVPGIREPVVNLLRDKSSIFYAQKAEV